MVEDWKRVPFTRGTAVAAGVTPRELGGSDYRRLFHNVHVSSQVPCTPEVRARGALLVAGDGAGLCHRTAARMWGGVVPPRADVDVAVPIERRVRTAGVSPHRFTTMPPMQVLRGLPVVAADTTFVHLATELGLVDLVVLGDSLVRRRVVTPGQLVARAAAATGAGAALAQQAAALVRVGVDSAPESRVRMLLVLAGLPEPVVDRRLRDDLGNVVYRLDLSYVLDRGGRRIRVAIEYDGRHHTRPDRRAPDLMRREDLEGGGWVFIVLVAEDLFEHPARTLERVVRIAGRAGVPMPRRLDDRWRRYFPEHG